MIDGKRFTEATHNEQCRHDDGEEDPSREEAESSEKHQD